MKSINLKFFGLLLALPFFLLPFTAKAGGNFVGVKVVVEKGNNTRVNDIGVDLWSDSRESYTGGDLTRACYTYDTQGRAGAFVNLQGGDNPYYRSLSGFKTGGAYNYGGYYDNANGEIFFGNGVNSASNGGGNGFGFACSCNYLRFIVHVPSGYYYDSNNNGMLDNGEPIGPVVYNYTESTWLTNDYTYTFTFHLGDMPTLSRDMSYSTTTPNIGDTITVSQRLTHNNDGDPIASAYIRNNFANNGYSSSHDGTTSNPKSISDVKENLSITPTASFFPVNSGEAWTWRFYNGSGYAIFSGTWWESYSFRIRNDVSLGGKVVGSKVGGGVAVDGALWDVSPERTFTIQNAQTAATLITAVDPPEAATAAASQSVDTTIGGGTDPIRYATYSMTSTQQSKYVFKNWTSSLSGSGINCVNDGSVPIVNGKIQIGRGSTYSVTCTAHFTPNLNIGILTDFNNDGSYDGNSDGGNVTTADGKIDCVDNAKAVQGCRANYNWNDYANITATPATGFVLDHLDISTTAASSGYHNLGSPINVQMYQPQSVVAYFKRKVFTITPSTDAGCTVSPNSNQTVINGANSVPFTGDDSLNYRFDGFSIDGGATVTTNPYTFTAVVANHTIKAKCTYIPPNTAPSIELVSPPYWNNLTDPHPGEFPPSPISLIATAKDDNGDKVDLEMKYQPAGGVGGDPAVWTTPVNCNITNNFLASPLTRTCTTASLTDGNWWWAARAKDEHGLYSPWSSSLIKIVTPAPAPTLTCNILPTEGGQAPLVVKATYTVTNPNGKDLVVNMGDGIGTSLTKEGGPAGTAPYSGEFFYTYKTANTYNATFSLDGASAPCPKVVTVTHPNGGSGGEVSP